MIEAHSEAALTGWLQEEGDGDALVLAASPAERRSLFAGLGARTGSMERHGWAAREGRRLRIATPADGAPSIQGMRYARVWATPSFLSLTGRDARDLWREAWWRLGLRPPEQVCAIGEGEG
jgi:hypothetical protein